MGRGERRKEGRGKERRGEGGEFRERMFGDERPPSVWIEEIRRKAWRMREKHQLIDICCFYLRRKC